MSPYKPRAQMTPDQLALARREAKRRRYLAQRGTPSRNKDISDIQCHLRRIYRGGMTSQAMAARSGVSRDTIMHVIKGYRTLRGREVPVTCLLRSTIDKLWTIELELPPDECRAGAHLPPLGTRRRLQALSALGYDGVWIAEQLGVSASNLSAVIHGQRSRNFVYAATAHRVAALYAAYQHTDPTEAGRSAWQVSIAKSRAAKKGYAPPSCWDDDAIDSPGAEPEWTGACGTPEGYAIHRREHIPMCTPCRRARRARLTSMATELAAPADSPAKIVRLHPRPTGRTVPRSATPALRRPVAA
ncbi:hypothetical protein [Streptomyces sp. NPDC089919]|uniref:hypothetical protein n=1 Tax=Streptomyces sp. NPDC089919 TaxID=3155188 RepID=UPI003447D8AC